MRGIKDSSEISDGGTTFIEQDIGGIDSGTAFIEQVVGG